MTKIKHQVNGGLLVTLFDMITVEDSPLWSIGNMAVKRNWTTHSEWSSTKGQVFILKQLSRILENVWRCQKNHRKKKGQNLIKNSILKSLTNIYSGRSLNIYHTRVTMKKPGYSMAPFSVKVRNNQILLSY